VESIRFDKLTKISTLRRRRNIIMSGRLVIDGNGFVRVGKKHPRLVLVLESLHALVIKDPLSCSMMCQLGVRHTSTGSSTS
jgi:hypothetical protein